ncbi:hypothetical protein C8C83_2831 [Flavobacterium sp. 90]|nr:hypothetical protein C8C82_3141 [Flavobacterium sp. 81]TCK54916.1 hypothetical protein C8C83_2831 [Flavobacterium sp. 90]
MNLTEKLSSHQIKKDDVPTASTTDLGNCFNRKFFLYFE